MTDPWWPTGFDSPAFRVKRESIGTSHGGDFVRGSSVTTLPSTALRYPTRSIDIAALSPTAKGLLFVKAYNYETIEIMWNWPHAIEDTWVELALVRSAFGCPIEVTEGETVFRALRTDFPVTTVDGVDQLLPPPIVYDTFPASLVVDSMGNQSPGITPNGHWYYYTLFFRTNPQDWTAFMSDQCLLPKNYGHSNHLWDGVPPYYQWTDDNYRVGSGFLRQFLSVFGFDLDRIRGFVESLLELHHIDTSPIMLLRHLGANYGVPYEAGIGDVRYRALLASTSNLLSMRGTTLGLEQLVETVSKYECTVTGGTNLTLLPDDSNFITSTGHWAPIHPSTVFTTPPPANYLAWNLVNLTLNPSTVAPPTGAVGSMLVDSADGAGLKDIFITAGDGKLGTNEFIPLYAGIPCHPGDAFGLSAWVKMAKPSPITPYLIPFTADGQPSNSPGPLAGLPTAPPNTNWFEVRSQGIVPANCFYIVPGLYFSGRINGGVGGRSPRIDVAEVMVYSLASNAPVALVPPDRYLTMGDPAEKLGQTKSGYDGFYIGEP
jgi:phage tail-like protein